MQQDMLRSIKILDSCCINSCWGCNAFSCRQADGVSYFPVNTPFSQEE